MKLTRAQVWKHRLRFMLTDPANVGILILGALDAVFLVVIIGGH